MSAAPENTDIMVIESGKAFVKFNQDSVDTLEASKLTNWETINLTIISFATTLAVGSLTVGVSSAALLY